MIKKEKGFIALFSVVIISFVLILVAVTLSFTGYFSRYDILDSENKKRSEALAEACLESARLAIAIDNYSFTKTEVSVGNEKCYYRISTDKIKIIALGVVNNTYTYYWVEINGDYSIKSFKEYSKCDNTLSTCP
jgi:hypothetical protein